MKCWLVLLTLWNRNTLEAQWSQLKEYKDIGTHCNNCKIIALCRMGLNELHVYNIWSTHESLGIRMKLCLLIPAARLARQDLLWARRSHEQSGAHPQSHWNSQVQVRSQDKDNCAHKTYPPVTVFITNFTIVKGCMIKPWVTQPLTTFFKSMFVL